MCYRLGCLFQNVRKPPDDGFIRILIFGATGMTGSAVMSAALTCIWFRISVFTRGMSTVAREELMKKPLTRIVEGDMFDYDNVLEAMTDTDAVFFSTTYWDTMRVDCEYDQGCNVVKAAMASGIKHIIYVGTPYCSLYVNEKCKYLAGKEKVEAHVVSSGLPYTILHLGFYYENFLSVFRPHMVQQSKFALALPMGDVPLNCGSVLDFGMCIAKIMLRPAANIFKTIKLATGYHTVTQLVRELDDHFPHIQFYDPKIPLSVYRSFDFKGSQDLASMFAYYQTIEEQWPQNVAFNFYNNSRSFKDWIIEQEHHIIEAITENMDQFGSLVELQNPLRRSRVIPRETQLQAQESTTRWTSGRQTVGSDNIFVRKIFNFFSETPLTPQRKHLAETDIDEKAKMAIAETQLESQRRDNLQLFSSRTSRVVDDNVDAVASRTRWSVATSVPKSPPQGRSPAHSQITGPISSIESIHNKFLDL